MGAWVIALLVESGRKKLTALVFGTEQQRALRTAAIELTARDVHPADDEMAGQLALVIDHVFNKKVADDPPGANTTMLGALQAGIGADARDRRGRRDGVSLRLIYLSVVPNRSSGTL